MVLPLGVISKKLIISPGIGATGDPLSLEVSISVEHPLSDAITWGATGDPLVSLFELERRLPGIAVIIDLPVVDQAGWVDTTMSETTGWHYKVTVRYMIDGRKTGARVVKYIKPYEADPVNLDFDLLPSGEAPIYRGPPGVPGESAYQVAVRNGYEGTEVEWLASLANGQAGPPGQVEVYTHTQTVPEAVWTIHHNLGRYPAAVTLVDSSKRMFFAEWRYSDINTVQVTMTGAQSGSAYVL